MYDNPADPDGLKRRVSVTLTAQEWDITLACLDWERYQSVQAGNPIDAAGYTYIINNIVNELKEQT